MSSIRLRADIYSLRTIMTLGRFVPARVQRDYQWQEQDCEALIADLEAALFEGQDEKPDPRDSDSEVEGEFPSETTSLTPPEQITEHFLGSVVLHRREDGVIEIFDGLQRFTTLTILASVLRDSIADETVSKHLHDVVMDGGAARLKLDGRDETLFKEIQKPGEAMIARRKAATSDMAMKFRTARRVFAQQSQSWGEAKRTAFAQALLDKTFLAAVFADGQRFARRIFLSTNLRGVKLDRVELFKGMLIDIAEREDDAALIAKHWAGIHTRVGNDMDAFLSTVDFIARRQPQGADSLAELATHLRDNVGSRSIVSWTVSLAARAGAWEQLQHRLSRLGRDPLDAAIFRLRAFKWREWLPLALRWYSEGQPGASKAIPPEEMLRRFDQLHRRCMAITLCDHSDVTRAKIFARAVHQTFLKRRIDPLGPKGALNFDAGARSKIRTTLRLPLLHDAQRLALMRWTEACMWRGASPEYLVSEGSVEHILPRNPRDGSHWLKAFPNEEVRFNSCHSLGNLALIGWEDGERIGNADFVDKLPTYQQQASRYRSLTSVVACDDWNANTIAARANELSEYIWMNLGLPEGPEL